MTVEAVVGIQSGHYWWRSTVCCVLLSSAVSRHRRQCQPTCS